MLESFESDTAHTDIFPIGKPFKSLYAVHSLRQYIVQSPKVSPVKIMSSGVVINTYRELPEIPF